VSCLVVTKGRAKRIKLAVECYLRQTYSKKQLLILSQGERLANLQIASHLRSLGRDDIHFFEVPQILSLGELRNLSVELATGEIVCQWDDDDIYHPKRLDTQYNLLRSDSRNVACAYSQFLKHFERTREVYWCDWCGERLATNRFLSGSVMFYKRIFGMFPLFYPQSGYQSRVEEDWNAMSKIASIGQIANATSGHEYVYVYHGDNVYDESHHNLTLELASGKRILSKQELLPKKSAIEETFLSASLNGLLIKSKEEVAFSI
jgi:glycosyltransferase involved in cell wall biosynthesis